MRTSNSLSLKLSLLLMGLSLGTLPVCAAMSQDDVRAFESCKSQAEKGDQLAQFNLGNRYLQGDGVLKDDVNAIAWYRKSAEQGNADAQVNLGACYSNGIGLPRDPAQGMMWYRKAAEKGHAPGQYNLGQSYAVGLLETQISREEVAAGQKRTRELRKEIEDKMASKKSK